MADFGLLLLVLSGYALFFLITIKIGAFLFNQVFPQRKNRRR